MPVLSSILSFAAIGLAVFFLIYGSKTGLNPLVQWGSVFGLAIAASVVWSIANFVGWLFGFILENWIAIAVVIIAFPILIRGLRAVRDTYRELPAASQEIRTWGRRIFAAVFVIGFFVFIIVTFVVPFLIDL